MSPTPDPSAPVSAGAVLRGALLGLGIVIPASVAIAVIDALVDDDGVRRGLNALLVVVLFVAYGIAGWRSSREEPLAPLTHGALGGVLTLGLWLPIRLVIFLVRGEDRDLFGGDDPVFTLGQLFGQTVIAAILGIVGGLVASGQARRRPIASDD